MLPPSSGIVGRYQIFLFLLILLAIVSLRLIDTRNGSQDLQVTSVMFNVEDVVPKTTWTYAGWLKMMYRTAYDDVGEKAQIYFSLILNQANKMPFSITRRIMIAVAEALEGKVIYARMLSRITGLYCDGRVTFSTLKFVNDVEKIIKQFLKNTGRGWGKPTMSGLQSSAANVVSVVRPADEHASQSVTGDDKAIPYFNSDTRPNSLMIPWRPEWPVMFAVSRTLAVSTIHCSTTLRQLQKLTRPQQTMLLLVTSHDRCLKEAVDDGGRSHHQLDCNRKTSSDAPNVSFYSAIVLASVSVCWAVGL